MKDIKYFIDHVNNEESQLNVFGFDSFTDYRYKPGLYNLLDGKVIDCSFLKFEELLQQIDNSCQGNIILDNFNDIEIERYSGDSQFKAISSCVEQLRTISINRGIVINLFTMTYQSVSTTPGVGTHTQIRGGNSLLYAADNVLFITKNGGCELIKSRLLQDSELDASDLLIQFNRKVKIKNILDS